MKRKQVYYTAMAAAMIAGLASCSSEEIVSTGEGDSVVTFTAQLPSSLSRTYGDGLKATTLHYAVYEAGSTTPLAVCPVDNGYATEGTATFTNLTATVQVSLAQGKTYDFMFWADAGEDSPYKFDAEGQKVTIDYTNSKFTGSNENLDAFYGSSSIKVDGASKGTATLTRPFAQLNIGTSDITASTAAAFVPATASVTVTQVGNEFSIATGKVTSTYADPVTFAAAELPGETFPVNGYQYLSMNYVLVGGDDATTDVTLNVFNADKSKYVEGNYTGVPVKANYRTNIYGALLTNPVDYNVTINKDFAGGLEPVRVSSKQEFEEALEAAQAAGEDVTIILDEDITLGYGLSFGSTKSSAPASRSNDGSFNAINGVTISLGGHKMTVSGSINLYGDAELNIINGTVACNTTASGKSGIYVEWTSTLNLTSVTLTTDNNYLNSGIFVGDQATVNMKDSKIYGPNSISLGISTNASNLVATSPSFTMNLENVEVDIRDTALFSNNPATISIKNCTFKSFLQPGMLRGGDYTFEGDNYFILVPERGRSLGTYNHWQTLDRGTYWHSNGNYLPSAAMVIGNYTNNDSYYYRTKIDIADGAHVYAAVQMLEGSTNEEAQAECPKFCNVIMAANQGDGYGVYMNKLPEVKESMSALNFVYITKNIFLNGVEQDVYDPASAEGWVPTAEN